MTPSGPSAASTCGTCSRCGLVSTGSPACSSSFEKPTCSSCSGPATLCARDTASRNGSTRSPCGGRHLCAPCTGKIRCPKTRRRDCRRSSCGNCTSSRSIRPLRVRYRGKRTDLRPESSSTSLPGTEPTAATSRLGFPGLTPELRGGTRSELALRPGQRPRGRRSSSIPAAPATWCALDPDTGWAAIRGQTLSSPTPGCPGITRSSALTTAYGSSKTPAARTGPTSARGESAGTKLAGNASSSSAARSTAPALPAGPPGNTAAPGRAQRRRCRAARLICRVLPRLLRLRLGPHLLRGLVLRLRRTLALTRRARLAGHPPEHNKHQEATPRLHLTRLCLVGLLKGHGRQPGPGHRSLDGQA